MHGFAYFSFCKLEEDNKTVLKQKRVARNLTSHMFEYQESINKPQLQGILFN